MARRVFYSFHYAADAWRTSQVRNIGVVEGNRPVTDNTWEEVKRGGDAAVQRWIDAQLDGRSCSIVLIGAHTSERKWIRYEIERSWALRKGLVGIYIHKLLDQKGQPCAQGLNPFASFNLGGVSFDNIVPAYDPPYWDSKSVYRYISENLEAWVEDAISTRARYL